MTVRKHYILAATFATLLGAMGASSQPSTGQTAPCAARQPSAQLQRTAAQAGGVNSVRPASLPLENSQPAPPFVGPEVPCAPQLLFDVTDAEAKFRLESMMSLLRDSRHESWVLAAYPDPKTSRPLIGAGFSLDVDAREHVQGDPLNPHTFLEPSSAQLWEAAGLDPPRLP